MLQSTNVHTSQGSNQVLWCAGIDPNPPDDTDSLSTFLHALERHRQFLRETPFKPSSLKPNLAFFLRHGHRGLQALQDFTEEFRDEYPVYLDAKFGEVSNTLDALLKFVFKTLKVQGVTLNPFLGEKSLHQALEMAAQYGTEKSRVYVLCVTSQTGEDELSYIPDGYPRILRACEKARNDVFGQGKSFARTMGVVVGANQAEVLKSHQLLHSGLSVLCPGLGPQGADWGIVQALKTLSPGSTEFTFPLQRAIFGAGSIPVEEMHARCEKIMPYFTQHPDLNPRSGK